MINEINFNSLIYEILIPLEDNISKNKKNNIFDDINNLEEILSFNITNFRSILYEKELLRFFLIIKNNTNFENDSFLNNIEFEIQFQLSSKLENKNSKDLNNLKTELNLLGELSNSLEIKKNNINKKYINNKICILELFHYVNVPIQYLFKKLDLVIKIKKRINNDFMNYIQINNLLDYSDMIYEYKIIKKITKEIKIIRPISIKQIKQLDRSSNLSIFTIKIENITNNINYLDKSLRFSEILKNLNENEITEVNFGFDLIISNIKIFTDKTKIDNKMILNIDKFEQNINFNDYKISLNNFKFIILNKNFPICIKPKEEYNLIIKLEKYKIINDKNFFDNQIEIKNNINNILINNEENNEIKDNENIILIDTENYISEDIKKKNKKKFTFFPKFSQKRNKFISDNNSNKNYSSSPTTKNRNKTRKISNSYKIFKYDLNTPISINLDSNNIYNSTFFNINLKWKNEMYNNIYIKFIIDDNIFEKFKFFKSKLILTNISNKNNKYSIIFNNSYEDFKLNENNMNLPEILSEFKNYDIGVIESGKEKEIILRFYPLSINFLSFPQFKIKEHLYNKEFLVIFSNKIFIN